MLIGLIRRCAGAVFTFLDIATESGDPLLTESGDSIDLE